MIVSKICWIILLALGYVDNLICRKETRSLLYYIGVSSSYKTQNKEYIVLFTATTIMIIIES